MKRLNNVWKCNVLLLLLLIILLVMWKSDMINEGQWWMKK